MAIEIEVDGVCKDPIGEAVDMNENELVLNFNGHVSDALIPIICCRCGTFHDIEIRLLENGMSVHIKANDRNQKEIMKIARDNGYKRVIPDNEFSNYFFNKDTDK